MTWSGSEPDALQPNDTIRVGRESLESLGNTPKPLVIVEKDVSPVGEVYTRRRRIVVQTQRKTGVAARGGQSRIKLPVAVFAPIEKSVACQPDADVSIGVRPTRPDHKRHLVVAVRGVARQSVCFEDFDLHIKSGIADHRLNNLRNLGLQGAVGYRKRKRGPSYSGIGQQLPRPQDVSCRDWPLLYVPRAVDGMRLISGDVLPIKDNLHERLTIEGEFERFPHSRVLGEH